MILECCDVNVVASRIMQSPMITPFPRKRFTKEKIYEGKVYGSSPHITSTIDTPKTGDLADAQPMVMTQRERRARHEGKVLFDNWWGAMMA